jgi:integrase
VARVGDAGRRVRWCGRARLCDLPKDLAALRDVLSEQHRRTSFRGDDELVFCHTDRGTVCRAGTFKPLLLAALSEAGIEEHVRAFHDLRHASLTNGAAAGESPIALMTRAGHTNMSTTKRYLHLAGTVFRDEAEALEQRLLGGGTFYQPSTDLSAPEPTSADTAPLEPAVSESADPVLGEPAVLGSPLNHRV